MSRLVTLYEAASYLEVSKSTLRNWDREGKLKAQRHPLNNYRLYDIEDLKELKDDLEGTDEVKCDCETVQYDKDSTKSMRKIISRMHNIIRDSESNSNIILRFDELTKLVFLKLYAEKDNEDIFKKPENETDEEYCTRIRNSYSEMGNVYKNYFPSEYTKIICGDNTIIKCGEILSGNNFSQVDVDIKGLLYEEVIKGTFDKNDNQQFFTPQAITSFMVDMMLPFISGNLCDPACGTGGFLIEALKNDCAVDKVYALEIDKRLQWIAGINLLLHGGKNFTVDCSTDAGSLGDMGDQYSGKMDIILTNPPFGSDVSDASVLKKFKLGKGKASRRRGVLFIEKCCDLLKLNGYMGIVIDEGVLNASNNSDARSFILENFEVLAIINLPDSAFLPYASVNTSIMLLKKVKNPKNQHTFFAQAEKIGRKANGDEDYSYDNNGRKRINSDLPEIVEKWYKYLEGEKVIFNNNLYVSDIQSCIVEEQSNRLDFQFHHYARGKYKKLFFSKKIKYVPLMDLCDERNESTVPSTNGDMPFIQYTGLANIGSYNGKSEQIWTASESIKSAVKRYEAGDIIFARMRPNLRKVSLMSFEEGGYVSPECSVFSIKKNETGEDVVDREYLAIILRSDIVFSQLLYKVSGVGRPRLSPIDLRKVMIPVIDMQKQKELVATYNGNMKFADQLTEQANQMMKQVNEIETTVPTKLLEEALGYGTN